VRGAYAKYKDDEKGKAALTAISHDLEEVISQARDQQRWRLVMAGIQAYEILNPGATKMNRLKERAQLWLNRPDVTVKGFFDDKEKGDVYAFLHVTLHPSNEVRQVRVRKGEEFCGLRLVDFIGKLEGVTLEYIAIPGETLRLLGP